MPSSFSYQHPKSGEWAHNLSADISDDVCNTYIDPIWDDLCSKGASHLRILEVGFGRGFNCAEIIKRCAKLEGIKVSLVGLEPHPEILEPWPEKPATLIAPWWGNRKSFHTDDDLGYELEIRKMSAQQPLAFCGGPFDAFIVDLFSVSQHPQHWEEPFIANMTAAAAPNAVLASYCCARVFRDQLNAHGWRPRVLRRANWRDTLVAVFDG